VSVAWSGFLLWAVYVRVCVFASFRSMEAILDGHGILLVMPKMTIFCGS